MAEKKMEQVAAMNNFYKLIGRNGELINLRKEQVLAGAMQIIQQHYADKQNKMEAVAKLLGQKINKRFTVEYFNTKFDCMFFISVSKKYDFKVLNEPEFSFCFTEQVLYALITGRAVVIND